jgi:hypothetical protein
MKTCPRLVLLTFLLTCSTVAFAQTEPASPAVIKLGSGFNYSRGDYGFPQDTELWSVPLNLSYDIPRWSLKAAFSHLTVKGPANVATGITPSPGPARPTSAKQSGIGDTSLSATYHANPVPGELNVDFTARVKLPTGDDDKGLSTGETDYYFQTDVNQTFGKVTLLATAGYRFMGSNEVTRLKDGLYAMAGAAYRLTDKTVAGAAYDWHSRIIEGSENAHNILAFVATNPNDRWNLLAYGLVGLNDASPEIALGGLATYKF